MINDENRERVDTILSEVFNVKIESVDGRQCFKEFDSWDSLGHMMFITQFEKAFELELTAEEIISLTSLNAINQLLESRKVTAE